MRLDLEGYNLCKSIDPHRRKWADSSSIIHWISHQLSARVKQVQLTDLWASSIVWELFNLNGEMESRPIRAVLEHCKEEGLQETACAVETLIKKIIAHHIIYR